MLIIYIVLLVALLIFALLAFLKRSRFRGYAIPARVCYALMLVELIWVSMRTWYRSSILTLITIVVMLVLIGLLETGFRNKLQNWLSDQLIWVTGIAFVAELVLSILMMKL